MRMIYIDGPKQGEEGEYPCRNQKGWVKSWEDEEITYSCCGFLGAHGGNGEHWAMVTQDLNSPTIEADIDRAANFKNLVRRHCTDSLCEKWATVRVRVGDGNFKPGSPGPAGTQSTKAVLRCEGHSGN